MAICKECRQSALTAKPKVEPPCSHGAVEQGGFATVKRNQNQKCDCASPKGEKEKDRQDTVMSKAVTWK